MLILIVLFFLGLITSFVGTNTGGSSLVTIPAMIALGLPPQVSIACARVTSIGTLIAGLRAFHVHKKIDYRIAMPAAILSLIGSSIGALIMTHIETQHLNKIIGILTLGLLSFSFFLKRKKSAQQSPSNLKKIIGYGLFLFTSMIGGFYGGQGLITTYLFVFFFNKTISESAGTRKVSALASTIAPCIIYGFHGLIDWKIVAALMLGTMCGATMGAHYALRKGDAWIEKLFMIASALLAIKLLISDIF